MKHDPHMTSRMLACGGMLLVAALCMFLAAHSFRIAENQKQEEKQHEQETV